MIMLVFSFPEKVNLSLQQETANFDQVREPFKAGFHYVFGVNFLPSEGNMAEKVFHKPCMTMFNVCFPYDRYFFIA